MQHRSPFLPEGGTISVPHVNTNNDSLDIDRNESLHIRLHLSDNRLYSQSVPPRVFFPTSIEDFPHQGSPSTFASESVAESWAELDRNYTQADAPPGDVTLDDVLEMPDAQFDIFRHSVLSMETTTRAFVNDIYGPFASDRKLFPMITQINTEISIQTGSRSQRELFWAQHHNLRRILQDPSRCVGKSTGPRVPQPTAAIQDYQTQLLLLDQRRGFLNPSTNEDEFLNFIPPSVSQAVGVRGWTSPPADIPSSDAQIDYQMKLMLLEQQNKRRLQKGRPAPKHASVFPEGVSKQSELPIRTIPDPGPASTNETAARAVAAKAAIAAAAVGVNTRVGMGS